MYMQGKGQRVFHNVHAYGYVWLESTDFLRKKCASIHKLASPMVKYNHLFLEKKLENIVLGYF